MSTHSAVFPRLGRVYFEELSRLEVDAIFKEIFEEETYRRHGIELRPGATVFDVGANIGLFSLYVDRCCAGQCSIFAFEPVPSIYRYLKANLAEHGLLARDGVYAVNRGLTATGAPRRALMTTYQGFPGNSTLYRDDKESQLRCFVETLTAQHARIDRSRGAAERIGRALSVFLQSEQVECEFTTVSEACREFRVGRIDLLKNDTEGSEADVLNGIEEETWPTIAQIVLETSGEDKADRLKESLRLRGFRSVMVEQSVAAAAVGLSNYTVYATRRGVP